MSPLFTAPCPWDHVSSYHKHLSLPWLLLSRNISYFQSPPTLAATYESTCFTLTFLWVLMPPQSWTRKGKDTGGCRPSRGWHANFKSTTHKAPFLQLSLPLHQKRPSSNHEALSMFVTPASARQKEQSQQALLQSWAKKLPWLCEEVCLVLLHCCHNWQTFVSSQQV